MPYLLITYVALTQFWYLILYCVIKKIDTAQTPSSWAVMWLMVTLFPVTATVAAGFLGFLIVTSKWDRIYEQSQNEQP